jgi:regulator of replication initiation timing
MRDLLGKKMRNKVNAMPSTLNRVMPSTLSLDENEIARDLERIRLESLQRLPVNRPKRPSNFTPRRPRKNDSKLNDNLNKPIPINKLIPIKIKNAPRASTHSVYEYINKPNQLLRPTPRYRRANFVNGEPNKKQNQIRERYGTPGKFNIEYSNIKEGPRPLIANLVARRNVDALPYLHRLLEKRNGPGGTVKTSTLQDLARYAGLVVRAQAEGSYDNISALTKLKTDIPLSVTLGRIEAILKYSDVREPGKIGELGMEMAKETEKMTGNTEKTMVENAVKSLANKAIRERLAHFAAIQAAANKANRERIEANKAAANKAAANQAAAEKADKNRVAAIRAAAIVKEADNLNLNVNYYTLLGVRKGASKGEIAAGYKRAMLKWHPDKYPGLNNAGKKKVESIAKVVGEAHRTLSLDWMRREYNRMTSTNSRST